MEVVRLGHGEPLVLVHFQGGHARSWEPVTQLLAEDFDVHAVALPGYGSTPPLREPATIIALARAVREGVGLERFHVAGCSLGGGVALELARQGVALSATALSPAGFDRGWETLWLHASIVGSRLAAQRATERLIRRPGIRRLFLWQSSTRPLAWPTSTLGELIHSVATAPGYWATERHALTERFRDGHELQCPVTIAWAGQDRLYLPRPCARRAQRLIPQAHHTLLPSCGHLPFHDNPHLIATTVRATAARATERRGAGAMN